MSTFMFKIRLLLLTIFAFFSIGQCYAGQTQLDELDIDPFRVVCRFLNCQDLVRLRAVSTNRKVKVDRIINEYVANLSAQVNSFQPNLDMGQIAWLIDKLVIGKKVHPRLFEALNSKFSSSGCLFIYRGSLLGSVLRQKYVRSVDLVPGQAAPLYEALFNSEFPEDYKDRAIAIDQLLTCLPMELYVQGEGVPPWFQDKDVTAILDITAGLKGDQPYHSFGLSEGNEEGLNSKPHHVVVTQQQFSRPGNKEGLRSIFTANPLHTLVLSLKPIDGWRGKVYARGLIELPSEGLPASLKRLTLVDNTGLCKRIGCYFLSEYPGLLSLDISRLTYLTTIEDYFLKRCTGITEIVGNGLIYLTSIGDYFCIRCTNLKSFESEGLTKLISIGSYCFSDCTGLTSFDPGGLVRVQSIGDCFLRRCAGLLVDPETLRKEILNQGKRTSKS